ncbi:MAG TPA: hypothetical protein VIC30_03100, partial [Orrella sp.]
CDWYDEARYRLRAGLAPEIKRIGDIARETVQEMQTLMASGRGKRIYALRAQLPGLTRRGDAKLTR